MTQALRLDRQNTVNCRVYRKSDSHYWTCSIRCYPATISEAVQQIQAWAAGLSLHPNFEVVTIDSVVGYQKVAFDFDHYTEILRKFFDNERIELD
jgi:hypothetical protein